MHLTLTVENPEVFPMGESALTYDMFFKKKGEGKSSIILSTKVVQEEYCYLNLIYTEKLL